MKLLVGLLLMAIFVAECSSSVSSRAPRQADDSEQKDSGVVAVVEGFLGLVEGIPVFGGIIKTVRTRLVALFDAVQALTNGGFARVLGGALPCKVSLDIGIRCTGLTREDDFTKLIVDVLNNIPVVPAIAITPISTLLTNLVNPILIAVFGGVYTDHV